MNLSIPNFASAALFTSAISSPLLSVDPSAINLDHVTIFVFIAYVIMACLAIAMIFVLVYNHRYVACQKFIFEYQSQIPPIRLTEGAVRHFFRHNVGVPKKAFRTAPLHVNLRPDILEQLIRLLYAIGGSYDAHTIQICVGTSHPRRHGHCIVLWIEFAFRGHRWAVWTSHGETILSPMGQFLRRQRVSCISYLDYETAKDALEALSQGFTMKTRLHVIKPTPCATPPTTSCTTPP